MRVLGDGHPDTLISRNNLAGAYRTAGDPARALPLLEQTLADSMRVLGDGHPHTLNSQDNLAGAYESAGDLGRASRCTSRPWPTGYGCSATTTPTP